ncbi:MAG: hypothetical protein ABI591_32765 [Kofleriaceae bacterium]
MLHALRADNDMLASRADSRQFLVVRTAARLLEEAPALVFELEAAVSAGAGIERRGRAARGTGFTGEIDGDTLVEHRRPLGLEQRG